MRIQMRLWRGLGWSEELNHQNLIVISPILLQGLRFAAVFNKSQILIKPVGSLVLADHSQLKLFDALGSMLHNCVNEAPSKTKVSRDCSHVHAPKDCLVLRF